MIIAKLKPQDRDGLDGVGVEGVEVWTERKEECLHG